MRLRGGRSPTRGGGGARSPTRRRTEGDSPLLRQVKTSSSSGTPPHTQKEPSATGNQLPYTLHKQSRSGGWKSKLKTLFRRGGKHNKGHVSGSSKQKEQEREETVLLQSAPALKRSQTSTSAYSTPPALTLSRTPSTHAITASRSLETSSVGKTTSSSTKTNRTKKVTPVSLSFDAEISPREKPPATTKNAAEANRPTTPNGRLGATPLQLSPKEAAELKSTSFQRNTTPQTESTTTTKRSASSSVGTAANTILIPNEQSQKEQATQAYRTYLSCGPSLFHTAAACMTYPDPETPVLEESSVSTTSAEANAPALETSEERRQRIWNARRDVPSDEEEEDGGGGGRRRRGRPLSLEEEQGLEVIFFQEDEEDWAQFPWSQQGTGQTERVGKDIFLSFADMGFDTNKNTPPPNLGTSSSEPTAGLPVISESVVSAQDNPAVASPTHPSAPTPFTRATTAPVDRRPPKVTVRREPLKQDGQEQRQGTATLSGPIPLSRTQLRASSSPVPASLLSPARSLYESVSSDQVVDRPKATAAPSTPRAAAPAGEVSASITPSKMVDRVSSVLKSVPDVFAKLAQSAAGTGPSSDSQIMLTRSSSQVTWVSHADDFAALDARPLTEIVIPSTPEGSEVRSGSAVQAIRNAIFDSIERGESEHKEGEDGDLDAPLENPSQVGAQLPPQVGPTLQPPGGPTVAAPLILSPSSLTLDSRFAPPLANVPVRQPSDGEDHPDGSPASDGKAQNLASGPSPSNVPPTIGVTVEYLPGFEEDLSLDESPPPVEDTYQPQPDTPGERRSLSLPVRSQTLSASTCEDDESVGLNALTMPDREKLVAVRKMSGDHYRQQEQQGHRVELKPLRATPPTPPRKRNDEDFGIDEMISSSWDFSGPDGNIDVQMPKLEASDDDSDSSSENIDHLLINHRHLTPPQVPQSFDESHSSILDDVNITNATSGLDFESVVETDISDDLNIFGCSCWEIPPLIERKKAPVLRGPLHGRGKYNDDSLLENVERSDAGAPGDKRGLGRKFIQMARSTSNSFKSIWSRRSQGEF